MFFDAIVAFPVQCRDMVLISKCVLFPFSVAGSSTASGLRDTKLFPHPPTPSRLCGLRVPLVFLAGLIVITLLVSLRHPNAIRSWKESGGTLPFTTKFNTPDKAVDYLAHTLGALFDEFAPSTTVHFEKKNNIKGQLWPTSKNEGLLDAVEISLVNVLNIRESHDGFVAAVGDKIPNFIHTKGA
jgi:hypothetical protein